MKWILSIIIFLILFEFSSITFLSYQKPKLIYSNDNEKIFIYRVKKGLLSGDRNCLLFNPSTASIFRGDAQGCVYVKNPDKIIYAFTKMIMSSLYYNPNPKRILVIGLGAATLPRAFHKVLPDAHVDIVDNNDKLKEINKTYFNFDLDEIQNYKFYPEDGFQFVKNSAIKNEKYDLIIMDAFDSEYIPIQFLTEEFMRNIKRIMSQNAIFAINTFEDSKTAKLENNLIVNSFGNKFVYLLAEGNKIIITNSDNEKNTIPYLSKLNENVKRFSSVFKSLNIDEKFLLKKTKHN